MKKIKIAGLVLLAPLALLCACGGTPTLAISANWYSDPALTDNSTSDKPETLEYKVEFVKPAGGSANAFTVDYETGTYRTILKSERRQLSDGTNETVYVYSTELAISGYYSMGDKKSEVFQDKVTTEAVFRNVNKQLAPISTKREVACTSPRQLAPETLEDGYRSYHYVYETSYDLELTKAKVAYTDLKAENPSPAEQELPLGKGATYLDNEQILFALRGVNLASIVNLRSINPVERQVLPLATSNPASTTVELNDATIGGIKGKYTVDAYKVDLSYQSSHPGATQTLWYAKPNSPNTYRGALLSMEAPVMYGLGTLRYTLVSADFTDK